MIFNVKEEDCRKIGVYSITNNINNKFYVGSTTTNFKHRYLQYKSGFLRKLDNQPVLYRAFRKYGFDNFTFEILCITDKENALTMEQFYINKGVDYNSCLIAGSLSGFKHSDDSKTRTVNGGNHHCAKHIFQFTLDGIFIKEHLSIIEALKSIGKTKNGSSHLTQCCIGNTNSAFGFKWSFNNKVLNRLDKRCSVKNVNARIKALEKKVIVIDDKKEYVYNSIKEASIIWGVGITSISNIIKGRNKKSFSKIKNKYITFKLV